MSVIEKSIELNVPVNTAYNQWTQLEEFPRFMEGVEHVHQIDDKHVHWKASIGVNRKNGMPSSLNRFPISESPGGVRKAPPMAEQSPFPRLQRINRGSTFVWNMSRRGPLKKPEML